jgi:hypothetical protein
LSQWGFEFEKQVERLVITYTGDPLDFDKSAKYKASFETRQGKKVKVDFKLSGNVMSVEVGAWNLEKKLKFGTEDQSG